MGHFTVEPLFIKSAGEVLSADYYRPSKVRKPPVILMAHGFAAERKFGLPEYAEALSSAGYAVILFDYRGFGGSTGKPRELVSPAHHVADWKSVLTWTKKRKDLDLQNIVLWGISLGGGHVITLAAREKGIKAIIALVPYVDGLTSSVSYPKYLLPSAMALAAQDLAGSKVGLEPIRIPVVAESGIRCLTGEDSYAGFMSMVPKGSSWVGLVPARILLTINQYRPTKEAAKIQCPALIIGAEKDSLTPVRITRKAASKIKRVEYLQWPIGHFELMHGRWFKESIKMQLAFLKKYIG